MKVVYNYHFLISFKTGMVNEKSGMVSEVLITSPRTMFDFRPRCHVATWVGGSKTSPP